MGDLEELFSRLKGQTVAAPQVSSEQPSIWAQPQQEAAYRQPSVSSPIFTPPPHTPNPVHASNVISPVNPSSAVGTPGPDQNRTNNLLNLLKFNNQSSQAGPMANLQNVGGTRAESMHLSAPPAQEPTQSRPLSAHDLMASLQRQPSGAGTLPSPLAAVGAERPEAVTSPSGDSKDFLLNLLKRPNATKSTPSTLHSQGESARAGGTEKDASVDQLAQSFATTSFTAGDQPQRETTPIRHFGSADETTTAFEAPQPTKASMFSYVNPFDQLHSSSPLNRTPKPEGEAEPKKFEILKHNRDASNNLNGQSSEPSAKNRKTVTGDRSPAPSPPPAQPPKSETVSEALKGIGQQVNEEVKQALDDAAKEEKEADHGKLDPTKTGDGASDSRPEVKKEDDVDSSWESAEDEEATKDEEYRVEVYNFPMKPFVSIHIKSMDSPRAIRQDNFIVVAQLKKEFDQIDRCLVSASQSHIVYAQVATKKDNGGLRIIRQDEGIHKQVFRSSGERVFHVQLCSTAPGNDVETVLGTGVNGSVFWTSVAKSRGELFADDDIEGQGFIMPPVATAEDQASGSPIKTRAKLSVRHTEYFAMARGNQIHIVSTEKVKDYCNKARQVDSEKYLAEHSLKIVTGKAGKDFCFSEDDTMIVSLDKSGRFKFWDIKDLTSRASDIAEGKHEPVELSDPVWTLAAAASGSRPDEKPSVSSIMFLDKERPTLKGVALRYLLIGFKQNHILQLWDLGLGKAVQEIRLPHEKDSDGICSITYHPKSGIIALGHPTRNSIYFIHLSAPKYNIAHMDQARYINLLARGDPTLPRPESTAIMSGLREFTFSKVGRLRSLDMLRTPVENASDPDSEDATLFELYVMHSKGVVGISVKRKDLGWDKDSKMVKPIDALKEGVIEVKELIPAQKLPSASDQSSNADATGPAKHASKTASKKQEPSKPSAPSTPAKNDAAKKEVVPPTPPTANGASREESTPERPSMQIPEATAPSEQPSTNPPLMTPESYAMAAQRTKSPTREKAVQEAANAVKKATSASSTAEAPKVSSNGDLQTIISKQFDALYSRIDGDKRVATATEGAKQDALLRLIQHTLTENVETSLHRIVSGSIEKEIIPALTSSTSKAVEKQVADILPQQLSTNVSKEVKAALPGAIQQALKDPHVHRAITDQVGTKVHQQISQLLQQSIPNIATQATQKMVSDLENRTKQQLQEAESLRQQDNAKIQELSSLVRSLSETIQHMLESQAAFQEQILKMQRPSSKAGTREDAASTAQPDPQVEAEEDDVARITRMLVNGQYDAATLEWLQSSRQPELFDQIFVRVNPRYLEKVTPLVALSVSAAITASFENHIDQRLHWLDAVLSNIDLNDPDIKDVAGKIMDVLAQRLQGAYMVVSEATPMAPSLRKISELFRRVGEVRRVAG